MTSNAAPIAAALAVAIGLAASSSLGQTPAQAPTSPRQQECMERWLAAGRARIVYGLRSTGYGIEVIVDEGTWNDVPYATKTGMVDTLNCMAFGDSGTILRQIDFLSHRTNKVLGEYRWGKLTVK